MFAKVVFLAFFSRVARRFALYRCARWRDPATVHHVLAQLVEDRLVQQDPESGRS
jgi:DNA-binding IclR family transcriptional regulator